MHWVLHGSTQRAVHSTPETADAMRAPAHEDTGRKHGASPRTLLEDASSLPGLHPEQHEPPVSLKEALKGHLLSHLSCRLDLPC